MSSRFWTAIVLVAIVSTSASAAEQSEFTYSGVYTASAQSQHAFTFDKEVYDDNYVVQMLRLNFSFAPSEHVKAVTRFDIAQGWWGVDNAPRSVQRTGTAGGSALFDFKDTNFLFHVDQAYVAFDIPDAPLDARVGRMWYGMGNKIMVDNNYDGVQVDLTEVIGSEITVGWARVSEGGDNLNDDVIRDSSGSVLEDNRDANLFTLGFSNETKGLSYDVFGMYYKDASVDDMNAFVPDRLQFFKTRFSPQITDLFAVGIAGAYESDRITVQGEFDYLTGSDDIANTTHGPRQNWDINDGDLRGYNIYLKADFATTDNVSLGAVVGVGSGDDDVTGGDGNVNKLRTSGFFYITEVWEDSIMPDEEGITPQGLGAPNVRGYRELENTTALQVNATVNPIARLTLFGSYTYLKATKAVHAWSPVTDPGTGEIVDSVIDPDVSADDLGNEVDFKVLFKLYPQMTLGVRGGFFYPGEAAQLLINGNTIYDDTAWELKGTIGLRF